MISSTIPPPNPPISPNTALQNRVEDYLNTSDACDIDE